MQVRDANFAHPGRPRGFTLVEVMISVALVLVLIIGVNQVFKITADTVGAGQVMSRNIRDTRAAQGVFFSDLTAAAQAPPMFIIASSRVSAFRNASDQAIDRDWGAAGTIAERELAIRTIDLDNDNTEGEPAVPGEIVPPAIYNHRSHRTDRLAFFARDLFQRQTANDGEYTNNTSSNEAWIWYGHLRLANNAPTPTYFQPGQFDSTTNRNNNNTFASQFALGRIVMLLRDPNTFAATENHIQRTPPIPAPPIVVPANPTLSPLSWESPRSDAATEPVVIDKLAWSSRYDLAATTLAQFQTDLAAVAPGQTYWWQRFLYAVTTSGGAVATPPPVNGTGPPIEYRFRANRFFTKPLDSRKAAELAPILLDGCSQFIVEFAGDYITQNNDASAATYGNRVAGAAGLLPDGITDFVIDTNIGTDVRSVRWYGMPRDVAGSANGGPDGVILRGTAGSPSVDVVPVRDVRGTATAFERNITTELPLPASNDYALPNGMAPNARYTCVWGPDTVLATDPLPQLLRITLVLDDANGRLAEGQRYEYVIDLPY